MFGRLAKTAAAISAGLFAGSLVWSLVLFSPVNSVVIAVSGGGLSMSCNFAVDAPIASQTVSGPVQLHWQEAGHRFDGCKPSAYGFVHGFKQFNIPLYLIFMGSIVLAWYSGEAVKKAAGEAGICRHCGYPRPTPLGPCPECGKRTVG